MLIGIIGIVIGLGSLICWIMEIIAAFKREEKPLLGILSIVLCTIGGFIIGWIKHKEWGIKKLMLIWTALIVAGIILNIIASAMGLATGAMMPGMEGIPGQ